MVLHASATMYSLNAPEPPQATALLLPRGPAQIRKASSIQDPVRSNWRFGAFFSGGGVSCNFSGFASYGALIQHP
jgi:hypothetical protein